VGYSTLTAGNNSAGIQAPEGTTLTIIGYGELTATGGGGIAGSAGIGGGGGATSAGGAGGAVTIETTGAVIATSGGGVTRAIGSGAGAGVANPNNGTLTINGTYAWTTNTVNNNNPAATLQSGVTTFTNTEYTQIGGRDLTELRFIQLTETAIGGPIINLSDDDPPLIGEGWTFANNVYTIANNADVLVTGSNQEPAPSQRRIEIAADATATVTLDDVNITGLGAGQSPIFINNGATLHLNLIGTSTLTAIDGAGIRSTNATLVIDGNGTLYATGGSAGAGIGGGGLNGGGGTITINGGTINATGGASAGGGAGIGGGSAGAGGTVTINNGIVNAIGGGGGTNGGGAGIGGGGNEWDNGGGGTTTISGGTVTAVGSVNGAGIGSGGGESVFFTSFPGNLYITGGNITAYSNNHAIISTAVPFANPADFIFMGSTEINATDSEMSEAEFILFGGDYISQVDGENARRVTIQYSPLITVTVAEGDFAVSRVWDGTVSPGTADGELVLTGILPEDIGTITVTATPRDFPAANVGNHDVIVDLALSGTSVSGRRYTLATTTITVPGTIHRANQNAPTVTGTATRVGLTYTFTITAPTTGAEFRQGSAGTWQDSNEFTGITPSTTHTFYARLLQTATHNASPYGYVTETFAALSSENGVQSLTALPNFPATITDTDISVSVEHDVTSQDVEVVLECAAATWVLYDATNITDNGDGTWTMTLSHGENSLHRHANPHSQRASYLRGHCRRGCHNQRATGDNKRHAGQYA